MDISQAQDQFKALVRGIDPHHVPGFLRWIKDNVGE